MLRDYTSGEKLRAQTANAINAASGGGGRDFSEPVVKKTVTKLISYINPNEHIRVEHLCDRALKALSAATQPSDYTEVLKLEHKHPVNSVSYIDDGDSVVTTSRDAVLVWDVKTGENTQLGCTCYNFVKIITASVVANSTKLVLYFTGSELRDGKPVDSRWICQYDLRTGNQEWKLEPDVEFTVVAAGDAFAILQQMEEGGMILYDATFIPPKKVSVKRGNFSAIALTNSKMGFMLAGQPDAEGLERGSSLGTIYSRNGEELCSLGGKTTINSAVFSNDDSLLATCGYVPEIWSSSDGKKVASIYQGDGSGSPACLALSPDNLLVALGRYDGSVHIYDVAERRLRAVVRGHTDAISDISFGKSSKSLITSSRDGTVRLWQAK